MTNKPEVVLPEPKFGEWLRGIYASERNPIRDGMYVRTIRLTGKFNRGKFYELTDGKGKFWMYPVESTQRIAPPADTLTRPAGDFVMVPRSAIDWLNGEGPEGFECPPDRYFRGEPPRYWWRSVFREKAGLSAAPQQGGQEEFANCCDTPAYCSSVRRCTRLDEAKPQQPAEAVAWWEVRREGDLSFPRVFRTEAEADRLIASVTVNPAPTKHALYYAPAIDIGKLRQIAAELRDNAHEHRQECRDFGIFADEQEAQFNEELAERIEATLIGDGGEGGEWVSSRLSRAYPAYGITTWRAPTKGLSTHCVAPPPCQRQSPWRAGVVTHPTSGPATARHAPNWQGWIRSYPMPNLATNLARVMELLEKATPGPWEPLFPMECGDRITDIRSDADGVLVAGCQYQMDGRAITAAINFLRQHGPEIAETFKETAHDSD